MADFHGEVISDTHLNMWKYKPEQIASIFPGTSPNLVLAGDIGDPDEASLHTALEIARRKYKRVIYIPGNHEFYVKEPKSKKTPAGTLAWFQKLDDQWDNFHFFYRRTELIDGVRIIGATGWSTSPKMNVWSNSISDEGRKDREFIGQALSLSKDPALIITHYPSTLRVIQENFRNKITEYDYGQNLEYMFHSPLHTWTFGHVHQAHDTMVPYTSATNVSGNVRILCNPYGYPNDGVTCPLPKQFIIPSNISNSKFSVKSLDGMSYRTL